MRFSIEISPLAILDSWGTMLRKKEVITKGIYRNLWDLLSAKGRKNSLERAI